MNITFLGGADEIGASSILIEVAGRQILVDAGMRPNKQGAAALPDLERIEGRLDAVILTHAHADHLAGLPVVHQRWPEVPVYTSRPTAALAKIMLVDSAYLQTLQSETPLYGREDVNRTVDMMRPLLLNRWYHLTDGVAVCLSQAGHLLGAASVLMDTAEGRLAISGDVSVTHQRAVTGFAAPPFQADVLILESTYGDNDHPPRWEEERRLVENVSEVVEGGGIALVPSFALGRAQEVMLALRQAQMVGEAPQFPIYADGLVRAISDVYNRQREWLAPALQEMSGHVFWQDRRVMKVKSPQRRRILGRPACIVASSGMLFGGPSVFYAEQLIEEPQNAIFITGYTDEESPGRRLQELGTGDMLTLNGEPYQVGCQVRRFGLSGHADASELVQIARHFGPREIYLVHGESAGRQGLKARLEAEVAPVILPGRGQKVKLPLPKWMGGERPFLLDRDDKTLAPSDAPVAVINIGGEAQAVIPRLGIQRPQKKLEGAMVREEIETPFRCILCRQEKLLTIDLSRRQLLWHCSECEHTYEEMITNVKAKDIKRMNDNEQVLLLDFIQVSVWLHEPVLDKNWRDLVAQPELWRGWLEEEEG
ncbi:MAG TPA: MBL fold metallo-hydrolase [Anaerolineae bacterium]|nr:MBL fold metallo-hydrolase [Anaerolineae bacterium]